MNNGLQVLKIKNIFLAESKFEKPKISENGLETQNFKE